MGIAVPEFAIHWVIVRSKCRLRLMIFGLLCLEIRGGWIPARERREEGRGEGRK